MKWDEKTPDDIIDDLRALADHVTNGGLDAYKPRMLLFDLAIDKMVRTYWRRRAKHAARKVRQRLKKRRGW